MKPYKISMLAIVLMGTFSFSQMTELPEEVVSSIEKRIAYGLSPSIVVGVVNNGSSRYYTFGKTRETGKAVNEHSIYEIGSISKVFTAILLAHQVVEGKVNLDDPISKFLPDGMEVPYIGDQPITLGHLSDHTSGLPRMPTNFKPANQENPYVDYHAPQLLEFVSTYNPTREVGAEYEYSNLAQGLLGYILAQNEGLTYEELLQQTIFSPLGMKETVITLSENERPRLAIGHRNGREVENWDFSVLAGAGGIRSSASDMLSFLSAVLSNKENNLKKAIDLTLQKRHGKVGEGVSLGWHLAKSNQNQAFWHNGGTGGYRSYAGVVPEDGKGVVVLTNSTTGADDIGAYILGIIPELTETKPLLAHELAKLIDESNFTEAWEFFHDVKDNRLSEYDAREASLNNLGYSYLETNPDAASAVFKMNIELYPKSSNVYDSYGEALLKQGYKEAAIENYKKSIAINPGNTNGIAVLKKLGVDIEEKEIEIPVEILESYVGIYAIQPTFKIEITREDKRLFAQATGQQRFEIFPKSEYEFYFKVVPAQIAFSKTEEKVTSFTLYQNGAEIKAVKE